MSMKMSASALTLGLMITGLALPGATMADEINAVTSIRPLHSLVANVTEGVFVPTNIVPANASPHNYALKPSDAQALQNAKVIFWVGDELEGFLAKAIDSLPQNARVVELQDHADHFHLLPTREVSLNEHDHGSEAAHHDEHDHDEHAHSEEQKDDHDEHGHDDHAHDDHEHAHGDTDLHLWLDIENAKHFVELAATELAANYPDHGPAFADNAANTLEKLNALDAQIKEQLAGLEDKKFVTFHDAYQYFENQYGLANAGTVTLSPEVKPGAKRLTELKSHLKEDQIACIFAEPQFDAKLVDLAIEGTTVKKATLDPLGASLEDGTELYFNLMREMSKNFADCLGQS